MTDGELLPPAVLKRKAVVYVRQSTQAQVQIHLESQRRQYELVDEARRRGFRDIEVIDDDLGRSASGMVSWPGTSPPDSRSSIAQQSKPASSIIQGTPREANSLSPVPRAARPSRAARRNPAPVPAHC